MNGSMNCRLDWCSHEAARYAVHHWHYSHSLPTPPLVKIGVWENARFIGCVLFSKGASSSLLRPYGLKPTEGCELTRVALDRHETPVSKIVSIAIRLLKKSNPALRLIVSFADPNQGHEGVIYQAMNWTYTGVTSGSVEYIDQSGKKWHSRQVSNRGYNRQYGELRRCPKPSECQTIDLQGKHRYLYSLDEEMKGRLERFRVSYPKQKSCATSETSDTPCTPAGRGRGSTDRCALT